MVDGKIKQISVTFDSKAQEKVCILNSIKAMLDYQHK